MMAGPETTAPLLDVNEVTRRLGTEPRGTCSLRTRARTFVS
jgi:hypothetical protein